jgi:hypothetical protein
MIAMRLIIWEHVVIVVLKGDVVKRIVIHGRPRRDGRALFLSLVTGKNMQEKRKRSSGIWKGL